MIFRRREKSSASASIADGVGWLTTILGVGRGGACSRRGDGARVGRGVEVDPEGAGVLSARSRGFVELHAQSRRVSAHVRYELRSYVRGLPALESNKFVCEVGGLRRPAGRGRVRLLRRFRHGCGEKCQAPQRRRRKRLGQGEGEEGGGKGDGGAAVG